MAIDGAKFRRPTIPGDRLDLEVEVVRFKGPSSRRGVAKVDGQVVAEGEFPGHGGGQGRRRGEA
jgi:3-hydroxyacyl-[acyl-carrier-protein] dehydratase